MRKTFIFLLLLLSFIVNGQKNSQLTWFLISLKGGYGSSILFNEPSFNDSKIEYKLFSPTYEYLGKLGVFFGEYVGLSFEVGSGAFSQKYRINNTFERNFKAKTFVYGPVVNLQTESGLYIDLGLKFVSILSAYAFDSDFKTWDFKNNLEERFSKVSLAMGFKPVMTEQFELKLGILASYGLESIVNSNGEVIPIKNQTYYTPIYSDNKTNSIELMPTIEFSFIFGKFGRASCGKYRFMFNN